MGEPPHKAYLRHAFSRQLGRGSTEGVYQLRFVLIAPRLFSRGPSAYVSSAIAPGRGYAKGPLADRYVEAVPLALGLALIGSRFVPRP
jgi:hypothetical protein